MLSPRIFVVATLMVLTQQARDGVVELTVKDSFTRNGIPAVRITLVYFAPEPPSIVTTFFTDSDGRVVIRNLEYGNYVLRMERDGYLPDRRTALNGEAAISFSIGPSRTRVQSESQLVPALTVTGRVLDRNGSPFPKADVSLLSRTYRNGLPVFSTVVGISSRSTTDDRGAFRLAGVPPGEYYLRADLSGLLSEASGFEHLPRTTYYPGVTDSTLAVPIIVRNIDVSLDMQLPRQPVFKISGTAVNPTAGAWIPSFAIGPANPDALEDPLIVLPRIIPSSDQSERHFEITGIPAGSHYLYPQPGIVNTGTSRTLVNIEDRDVEDLRIVMRPGVELTGSLIVDGDSPVKQELIRVSLRPRERLASLGQGLVGVPVSQKGEFTISGLIPDVPFGVRVSGLPQDAFVSEIRQDGRSVYNDGVISSSRGPIEVHINGRGGMIVGSVRDSLNQTAKQAAVVLVPDASRRANSLLYKRASTDESGAFTFRGLAPGEYQLFAWSVAPPETAEENLRFMVPYEGKGMSVRVTSGATAQAQLRLLSQ